MASISKLKNGIKEIRVVCDDGVRRKIRLGEVSMKDAQEVKRHIEALASAKTCGVPIRPEQAEWLSDLPERIYERINRAGLAPDREKKKPVPNLAVLIESFLESKRNMKPGTREQYERSRDLLIEHMPKGKLISEITPADCDDWKDALLARVVRRDAKGRPIKRMAEATVSKHVKRAKTFFSYAVKSKLIEDSPMDGIKCGSESNNERMVYVEPETGQEFLRGCTDPVWRLIFALGRYGGLRRCEIMTLRWGDILWDESMLRINSPKTGARKCPIFPELLPYVEAAFDEAPAGQIRCIQRYDVNSNIGKLLTDRLIKLGITTWEKPIQNLRASCRTDLEEQFPSHVIDSWLGHSESVAKEHYLMTTKKHEERALKSGPNSGPADRRNGPQQAATTTSELSETRETID